MNNTMNYRRINNIINNTQGAFVSLTTKNYSGTVNVLNVSDQYVTVKPVSNGMPLKFHKNSILHLKSFGMEYNRKYANYRFQ